jgi:MGT family glycosyltransferase
VELVAGAKYAHERLMAIWDEVRPDVIVSDNVTGFPAVPLAGVPWIRMVSANPLEMQDPHIPPVFSGYPTTDRAGWDEFRSEYLRLHQPLMDELSEFNVSMGASPLPAGEFQYDSPWLNLYLYPEEIDYERSRPLDPTWHRLGSTVRAGEAPFELHEQLPGEGMTIYLSLGSLGCNDLGLMQRLIDALDKTEYRVIVSMGPLADEMRLGERMYGDRFLPQPSILPQCDLLITHGGNNTLGEGFHFGLPMIVLPLFWDQYDNAQRVDETGFGVRLASYDWDERELVSAVERLLGDDGLRGRMRAIATRLQASPGGARGADLIERVLRTGGPVTT